MPNKTPTRIDLNPDALVAMLYAAVKGIESHSEQIGDERNGAERETKNEVTTIVRDVYEANAAKKLRNKIRSEFAKYVATIKNLTVSDTRRMDAYQREVQPLLDLVARHNAHANHHPVEIELTLIPINASLSDKAVQGIYKEIFARFDAVRDHFARGDVAALGAWVQRNKALGAFLPSVAAGLTDDAIQQVKEGLSALRAKATEAKNKSQTFDAGQAGRDLLASGALGALDNAQGLIAPVAPASTPPVNLAIVA